jgi:hypothetical protein
MDITVHTVRNLSIYGSDILHKMQRDLVNVFRDIVQVFTLSLRAAELGLQQFKIK